MSTVFPFAAPVPGSKNTQRMIIGTVSFASFIGALDMSIVNISVPAITKEWNIPIGLGSLVILSYLLTVTCLILIMGKLADRHGFRNIFLAGFFIFGIGSALCGIAPDILFLIGSRIVQAIGAAMLAAVSPAIVTRYLPESFAGDRLDTSSRSRRSALLSGRVSGASSQNISAGAGSSW